LKFAVPCPHGKVLLSCAVLCHVSLLFRGHVGPPTPCLDLKLVSVPEMGYTIDDEPHPRGEVGGTAQQGFSISSCRGHVPPPTPCLDLKLVSVPEMGTPSMSHTQGERWVAWAQQSFSISSCRGDDSGNTGTTAMPSWSRHCSGQP